MFKTPYIEKLGAEADGFAYWGTSEDPLVLMN